MRLTKLKQPFLRPQAGMVLPYDAEAREAEKRASAVRLVFRPKFCVRTGSGFALKQPNGGSQLSAAACRRSGPIDDRNQV